MKQRPVVLAILALTCAACGGTGPSPITTTTTVATTTIATTTTTAPPSPVLRADPGGPYSIDAGRNLTVSGTRSTSTPFQIAHYFWNCGQTPHGKPCTPDSPTAVFEYMKTGKIGSPNQVYTITLTIEDTMGNRNSAQTTVSVRQAYRGQGDSMAYSGRAEQLFHRALLRAFDRVTLEQFVVVDLDIELENVTRRGNFSDEVWDLVRWADRNDRLELIEKAAAAVPGNPHLQEAVRHVRDPELIEDRWFARFVPLTTWLIWVVNVLLLVTLVKVWMVNLIDITRLLLTVTLLTVVSCLGWVLYQRLIGGPVRTLAGNLAPSAGWSLTAA